MTRHFFVMGFGKSGTTWVQKLFDAHPRIACKGEGQVFSALGPALAKVMDEHNGRQIWLDRKNFGVQGVADFPHFTRDDFAAMMRFAMERLFGNYDGAERAQWLGEKTPQNVQQMCGGQFARFVELSARAWAADVGKAEAFRKDYPDRLMHVRYEDLTARPEEELARLFAFLDVRRDEDTLQACIEQTSFERMSRGRRRGQEAQASFFRKGVAGDWVNHFDDATAERFWQAHADMLQLFDYAKEPENAGAEVRAKRSSGRSRRT